MPADPHLHTFFSDGTFSPEEVTGLAREKGLRAIALTDHDTVEGCARMAVACQAAGIEFIPATELTAEVSGHEIHFLGYFVDPGNEGFLRELAKFQEVRQRRISEMTAKVNEVGIPLQAAAGFSLAKCPAPE